MSRELVHALLRSPAGAPVASAPALRNWLAAAPGDPFERAALGGLASAGVGWAFACGYEAAIARLDPAPAGGLAAMCATEAGGGHPRAIQTALVAAAGGGWTLSGRKTWVTLGAEADRLLVVATTGTDEQGRNRLRVARIEEAVASLLALRGVAACEPSRAETHVALAGAMAWGKKVLDAGAWGRASEGVRAGWERDRALLEVAAG